MSFNTEVDDTKLQVWEENQPLAGISDTRSFEKNINEQYDIQRQWFDAVKVGEIAEIETLLQIGADVGWKDNEKCTALHIAARNGHKEVVKLLLKSGAAINDINGEWDCALYIAAEEGHSEVVRLLLDNGAEVDIKNDLQNTALIVAAQRQHSEIFVLLMSRGAAINLKGWLSITVLHITAGHGDKELVALLLEKGAEVNAYTQFGTPLHLAVKEGYTEVAENLLDCGADIDAKDDDADTALHMAASQGNNKLVAMLLSRGAAFNAKGDGSDTPLHVSARKGHEEVVNLLLKYGVAFDAQNGDSDTALHLAARNGHTQLFTQMLGRCRCVNRKLKDGKTLLAEFSEIGDTEMVTLLLENGADIEDQDANGQTPLVLAVKAAQLDVVRLLISKAANMETTDHDSFRPLHWSAKLGHSAVINLLLQSGADIESTTRSGYTALHLAAGYDHSGAVATLINNKANIDSKSENEATPILIAISKGHTDVVFQLKDAGARIGSSEDNIFWLLYFSAESGQVSVASRVLEMIDSKNERICYMNTALHRALLCGQTDMVVYLLNSGAKTEVCDEDGRPPIFLAGEYPDILSTLIHYKAQIEIKSQRWGNIGALHYFAMQGQVDSLRLLLNCGSNVHSVDEDYNTALHYAALQGDCGAVETLFQHGMDINVKNKFGATALHTAVKKEFLEVTKLLIDFGIDIEAKNTSDSTALHLATETGKTELVLLLVQRQANVDEKAIGNTALHMATIDNHIKICAILIEFGADVGALNSYDETPLHLAIAAFKPDLVSLLLENEASIQDPLPRRGDSQQRYGSLLSYAIHHFPEKKGHYFERDLIAVIKILIKAGADLTGLEDEQLKEIEVRVPELRDIIDYYSHRHIQQEKSASLSKSVEDEDKGAEIVALTDTMIKERNGNYTYRRKALPCMDPKDSNVDNGGLVHIKHKYGHGFPPFKHLQFDNFSNANLSPGTTALVNTMKLLETTSMDGHAVAILQSLFDYFVAKLDISGNFYVLEMKRVVAAKAPKWASLFDKMSGIIREPGRLIVQFSTKKTTVSVAAWREISNEKIRFIDAIYVCRRLSTQLDPEAFSDILGGSEKGLAEDVHAILIAGLSILSIAGGDELIEILVRAILGHNLDVSHSVQTKSILESWQIHGRRQCPCNQTNIHRPLSAVAAAKAVGMSIWRERRKYIVTRVWDLQLDQLVKYIDAREVVFITHRWSEFEVDYQIVMAKERLNGQDIPISELSKKLFRIRETMLKHTQYVWIDTICIKKSNLSELDEAIRSMYKWYASCAAVVLDSDTTLDTWRSRGWCLQEGAAAGVLRGITKEGELVTIQELASAQGQNLCTLDLHLYYRPGNAAEILARMDVRETTREEDMAYALAGILSIDLTLAYGEGIRSRTRLLHQIAIQKGDLSFLSFHATQTMHGDYLPAIGDVYYLISECVVASAPVMVSHFGTCIEVQLVSGQEATRIIQTLDRWWHFSYAVNRSLGVKELLASAEGLEKQASPSLQLAVVHDIRSLILVETYDKDWQTGGAVPINLCYRLQCCQIEENEFERLFDEITVKFERIWLGEKPGGARKTVGASGHSRRRDRIRQRIHEASQLGV